MNWVLGFDQIGVGGGVGVEAIGVIVVGQLLGLIFDVKGLVVDVLRQPVALFLNFGVFFGLDCLFLRLLVPHGHKIAQFFQDLPI